MPFLGALLDFLASCCSGAYEYPVRRRVEDHVCSRGDDPAVFLSSTYKLNPLNPF